MALVNQSRFTQSWPIALLQKQPTINVINVTEGKPASLAEKIRSEKDPNVKVIIIKNK
jgi:hypothetical protein